MYRLKSALFQPDAVCSSIISLLHRFLTEENQIAVLDNAAVHHIFQNAYVYVKAPAHRPLFAKLLGRGLAWAEGDEHKYQRRLLSPAFTTNSTRGMSDDIFKCAEILVGRLHARIAAEKQAKPVVNIIPMISTCSLDMIGRVAFGFDFGAGETPEARKMAESWKQDVNLAHTFGGFFAPILINLLPWITKIPIPALHTDGAAKQISIRIGNEIFQANRGISQGKDILSLLAAESQKIGVRDRLSKMEILENMSTIIMAGHETTSVTVSFTLLRLARNPEAQDKLRQEMQATGRLDHDTILSLPYLDAVVREGLRLHPPISRTDRVALQDDVIPLSRPIITSDGEVLTSIPIKAGQVFHIPFIGPNVDAQTWGPDATEFRPERWFDPTRVPSSSDAPHGPWVNITSFCDGPRSCIGWRLALLETKVIVGLLVRSFEFGNTPAEIEAYPSPTLQPFVNGEGGKMPLYVTAVQEP
ncbi:cytochrome p450 [Moniliophthora roreri MCA 2997]|uniref:Cytochrome p450 n=1 Tax=Moniliophthora roreri (strain MCA 2997) TaxID=1381753 RepID=V2XI91_MONRO|nr:cytochrome p450 [Moniliophthora roreri MCA 2997]